MTIIIKIFKKILSMDNLKIECWTSEHIILYLMLPLNSIKMYI